MDGNQDDKSQKDHSNDDPVLDMSATNVNQVQTADHDLHLARFNGPHDLDGEPSDAEVLDGSKDVKSQNDYSTVDHAWESSEKDADQGQIAGHDSLLSR